MKKTDIHNHILWGIDDGAATKETALEMLRKAAEDGITEIIATPHFHYRKGMAEPQTVRKLTKELQAAADEEQIPVTLYTGNELFYTHDLLKELKEGECLTLAESKYVLLEFSVETDKRRMQNAVYQFVGEGFCPILAHIERYDVLMDSSDFLKELLEMGAYCQVNAGKLSKYTAWGRKRAIKSIIREGMIQFLATDAHDLLKRPPQFGKDAEWLVKKSGISAAEEILYLNPQKVLDHKLI